MKILMLLLSVTISISSFAQSPKVKAYFVKPDETNKIRRDTLQAINSLKLTDTTYKILSFSFGFTVHGFAKDTFHVIKNEGAMFNEKILKHTKERIRQGTTIVVDEIIIQNREGKTEKADVVFTNVY